MTEIHVYGRQDCQKCQSAKDKLNRLGFAFVSHDINYHLELHEDWRADGSVQLSAYVNMLDGDHVDLPVIKIDGEFYQYAAAMKKLKELKKDQGKR